MDNTEQLALILQNITGCEHLSPALKSSLTELSNEANVVCSNIVKDFEKHHGDLVRCSTKVARASDQSEVQVAELTTCLTSANESSEGHKDELRNLQTSIHAQIESCREEILRNEEDIGKKSLQIKNNEEQIKNLKSRISLLESEARSKEREADRLRMEIRDKEGQREKHVVTGLIGTGLFVAGTVLTGGAVAALSAGAAVMNAGVNAGGVIMCQESINSLESDVRGIRKKVDDIKEEIRANERKTRKLEQDIKDLERNIVEMNQAIEYLTELDKRLCTSIKKSDLFIGVVGDLCAAMDEAKLKTGSIKLIQAVISKKPVSHKYMDDFKEKWEALLSMLNITNVEVQGEISN